MTFFSHFRRFALVALASTSLAGAAHAVGACYVDLDGNGAADARGESATCLTTEQGVDLCPINAVDCNYASGKWSCPTNPRMACLRPTDGGNPQCSPTSCLVGGAVNVNDPDYFDPSDGQVDAAGNCAANVMIFSGRAMKCRPAGALTTFSNCCANKGKIIKDSGGGSSISMSSAVYVGQAVWGGMSTAYQAYQAGASAASAAQLGSLKFIGGIDPTSIAISIAVSMMIDLLLSGCNAQDMETGMLRGSDMCHEIGDYCSTSVLGVCIQKTKGHCCFNTKLGRIIQEQGRPQLKSFNSVGWGTAKSPYCRGFTPEEFQALDFSKMDLAEYYGELDTQAQGTIELKMKDKIDAYYDTVN